MKNTLLSLISVGFTVTATYYMQESPKHFAIGCMLTALTLITLALAIQDWLLTVYRRRMIIKNVKGSLGVTKDKLIRTVYATMSNEERYLIGEFDFTRRVLDVTLRNNPKYYTKHRAYLVRILMLLLKMLLEVQHEQKQI